MGGKRNMSSAASLIPFLSWTPLDSDPLTSRLGNMCVCVCFFLLLASLSNIEIAGKERKKGNGYSVDYGPGLRLLGERGSQTPRSPN